MPAGLRRGAAAHRGRNRADSGAEGSGYSRRWRRSAWPPRCSRRGEARCGVRPLGGGARHDDSHRAAGRVDAAQTGHQPYRRIRWRADGQIAGPAASARPQAKPTSAGSISPPASDQGWARGCEAARTGSPRWRQGRQQAPGSAELPAARTARPRRSSRRAGSQGAAAAFEGRQMARRRQTGSGGRSGRDRRRKAWLGGRRGGQFAGLWRRRP